MSIYLKREGWRSPLLLISEGLPDHIVQRIVNTCQLAQTLVVEDASVETEKILIGSLVDPLDCVIGLGGGKTIDLAKSIAFRLGLPFLAIPTSLSNDGFCSPNSSLTSEGKRFTQKARLPVGVVVDLEVVQQAPMSLWLSGVGDLVAKRTAIFDWRRAFHTDGTEFDDLAALLSDASVYQFLAYPQRDTKGIKLLAQGLLFNGVAMEMAGCSRPASGSEHLISHALDLLSENPRLHGLQVGLATYWMGLVQGQNMDDIDALFEITGFWNHWKQNPMSRADWIDALEHAPEIKPGFVTVLSEQDMRKRAADILLTDQRVSQCLC